VRLQKESDQKKKSEQMKKSENQERPRKMREKKKIKVRPLRENQEKQKNFYAKVSEIKRAKFSNRPMIVLLYKEALLNTNEVDLALPTSIASLLQEYKDVFPEETPHHMMRINKHH
jgi:hypothetical protein